MRPFWYDKIERAISPIEGHITAGLVALAIVTLFVAWKGDSVAKMGWFIYLVSP